MLNIKYSGTCGGRYYPTNVTLGQMRNGTLKSQWTLLEQKSSILAAVSTSMMFNVYMIMPSTNHPLMSVNAGLLQSYPKFRSGRW